MPHDSAPQPPPTGDSLARALEGTADAADHEQIATVAVEAFAAGDRPLPDLGDHDRRRVLVALLVQPDPGDQPPSLHRLLANYDSGGVHQVLPNAAEQLGPILADLVDGPRTPMSVVLGAMLLRAHLSPHLDDATIRHLHLSRVASFSSADLTLPYSCAFAHSFDANCEDLRDTLRTNSPLDPTAQLPLVHRLVFEWMTGIATGASAVDIVRGRDGSLLGATTPAEAVGAARSLAARHRCIGSTGDPTIDDDEHLGHLQSAIAREQESLPRSSPPAGALGRLSDRRVLAVLGARSLLAQRVPRRLARPRRRPRIAVCVSGQLRGYRQALETWRQTLCRIADCELFVHTWSGVGRSGAEGFRATLPFSGENFCAAYRASALRIGYEEISARYPTLFAELAASAVVDADELRAVYDTPHVVVQDDTSHEFDGWTNQDKMHWKIQQCHELAMAHAGDVDLVVRLRPDKPILFSAFEWRDLRSVTTASPTLFADREASVHYAQLVIGDQFALGAPGPMAVYSRTWSIYEHLAQAGLFACPENLSGHSSLAQVCWVHGIDVLRSPMRFGDLQEASPMPSSQIVHCLERDSEGRMDADDRALLAAVRADLGAGV